MKSRFLVVWAGALLAGVVASCSLFTSFDGFHDPPSGTSSGDGGLDGSIDGGDGGGGGGDASSDDGSVTTAKKRALIVAGGQDWDGGSFAPKQNVNVALVASDGTLGAFQETQLVDVGTVNTHVVATDTTAFILAHPTVYVGTVNTTAGTTTPGWTLQPGIDAARGEYCSVASGDSIFILGGANNSVLTDLVSVSRATIPLSWFATTPIPEARNYLGCAATDSFVYAGGGKDSSGQHRTEVVYAARTMNGVGEWKATTPLPAPAYWPRIVVVGSGATARLLVVGADYDVLDPKNVYSALIQSDGSLGPWQIGTPTPEERYNPAVASNGQQVFMIGGGLAAAARNTVYVSTVDPATGAMTPWTMTTALLSPRMFHGAVFVTVP